MGGGRTRSRYRGPAYRGTVDEGRWIADEESHGITGSTVHYLEVGEVSGAAATAEVDVGFEDDTASPRFLKVEGSWRRAGGGRSTNDSAPENRGEPGEE